MTGQFDPSSRSRLVIASPSPSTGFKGNEWAIAKKRAASVTVRKTRIVLKAGGNWWAIGSCLVELHSK
jgi:hypothetical protein